MKASTYHFILALLIIIYMALVAPDASAQTARGDKSLGPTIGYASRNDNVTGGLSFRYAFSRVVRIAPEVSIIFRNKDVDGLTMNANVEFPIALGSKRWIFYPLVGAGFTSWSTHGSSPITRSVVSDNDVTTHYNQLCLNAGAGFEFYATGSLKLNVEARYSLQRHFSTAFASLGIAYVF